MSLCRCRNMSVLNWAKDPPVEICGGCGDPVALCKCEVVGGLDGWI